MTSGGPGSKLVFPEVPSHKIMVWPEVVEKDEFTKLIESTYIMLKDTPFRFSFLMIDFLRNLERDLWIKGRNQNNKQTKDLRASLLQIIGDLIKAAADMEASQLYQTINTLAERLYEHFYTLYRMPVDKAPRYFAEILNKSTHILKIVLPKGGKRTRRHRRRGLKSRRRNRK